MTSNQHHNNPLETIIAEYAAKFDDAPGASRLAKLARTAKRIPAPLLDDLAALIARLDVPLVGDDISIHLIDVAYCDVRYSDATAFATEFKRRLQDYIGDPSVATAARDSFRERVAWWRMALSRAADVCGVPAAVLTENKSNG
jgi:hypothetical protein